LTPLAVLNKQEFFLGFSMPLRKRQTRLRPRKNIQTRHDFGRKFSRPFKLIWTVSALKDCTMLHIWYNSTGACFDEQPTYFATEPWRWHGERFALTQRYLSHSTIRCILLTENRPFRSYLFLAAHPNWSRLGSLARPMIPVTVMQRVVGWPRLDNFDEYHSGLGHQSLPKLSFTCPIWDQTHEWTMSWYSGGAIVLRIRY